MSVLKQLGPIKVTTTGDAGEATGSASVGIPGGVCRLLALSVKYATGAPATTDVTVTCTLPLAKTLLTLTNRNTDLPLAQITEVEKDVNGADRASPATKPQLVAGVLTVNVAQCNALVDAVIVTAVVEVS